MPNKICVGDIVTIIDTGKEYPSFKGFFAMHHIEHLKPDWDGGHAKPYMRCEVLFIGSHPRPSSHPNGIAVVQHQNTGKIYLINPAGLKLETRKTAFNIDDLLCLLEGT